MARVTVRTGIIPLVGSNAEMFPHGRQLADGWGRRAVSDVQRGPWADARFKRPTGRSRKAWRHVVTAEGLGLYLDNDATNRSGTRYAGYVHYAGTPRAAVVVDIVQRYMDETIGPELVRALGRDYLDGVKRRPVKLTTKTFGG